MKRQVEDLRMHSQQNGIVEECYLVEDSVRITSNVFKVWVPSVMGAVDNSKKVEKTKIDTSAMLNEKIVKPAHIETQGYIEAYNVAAYPYRYDGWIPHFQSVKITAKNGKWANGKANLSGPTTPSGCGPHTHDTTGTHQANSVEFSNLELTDIDIYSSSGVDLQNINNICITKGHKMYGCFVNGEQTKFIILAIDNVSPRLDSKTNDANSDIPSNATDGEKNPQNAKG